MFFFMYKMSKFIFSLFFSSIFYLGIHTSAEAQLIGKKFPDITGETLKDTPLNIPSDTKDKFTIIAMAYSKDAEEDLKTWLSPAYNKFIAKTGMFDADYNVNLYFIPMFSVANFVAPAAAKKKMKEDTNSKYYPCVLFYKGDLKKYKQELGFDEKHTAYFFVLDKEGKIVYSTSGKYSADKMEEIESKIE